MKMQSRTPDRALRIGRWAGVAWIVAWTVAAASADTDVALEGRLERWTWDDDDLAELSTRVAVGRDVGDAWRLELSAGHISASSDNRENVSSLADTRLRVTYRPAPSAVVQAILNGPTGQSAWTPDEFETVTAVASRLLAFSGARFGEGPGVELGAAYSFKLGPVAVGIGSGYALKGGYEPVDGDPSEYKPGARVTVSAGADLNSPDWLVRGNLRFASYGREEFAGEEVFKHGNRTDLEAMVLRRLDRTSFWGSARFIDLGTGESLRSSIEGEDVDVSAGNEIYLSTGVFRSWESGRRLSVNAGARLFTGNAADEGKASRFDVGARVEQRVGKRTWVDVGLGIATASVDQPVSILGLESGDSLTGIIPSLGLRTSF